MQVSGRSTTSPQPKPVHRPRQSPSPSCNHTTQCGARCSASRLAVGGAPEARKLMWQARLFSQLTFRRQPVVKMAAMLAAPRQEQFIGTKPNRFFGRLEVDAVAGWHRAVETPARRPVCDRGRRRVGVAGNLDGNLRLPGPPGCSGFFLLGLFRFFRLQFRNPPPARLPSPLRAPLVLKRCRIKRHVD